MDRIQKKWTRESLFILIKGYQKQECLYNKKNSDYCNRQKTRLALEAIVNTLKELRPQTTLPEIKYKLKTLRIQFLKEYKKVCNSVKNGTATYEPRIWWYKNLIFLRNFVKITRTTTNVSTTTTKATTKLTEIKTHVGNAEEINPIILPNLNTTQVKKEIEDVEEEAVTTLTEIKTELGNPTEENPWTSFGAFIAESLAAIKNKQLAKKMKHDILKIMMDGENKDDD